MIRVRERPRLVSAVGLGVYLLLGFTTPAIRPGTAVAQTVERCPAPAFAAVPAGERMTILQGNAWMLPSRPLLLPFQFSTDGRERAERLVQVVRSCRPGIVLLEEVFEGAIVDLLERSLPEYRVFTSGGTDFTGTVNASGLVTLSRLPVERVVFQPFAALPADAQAIEKLGRKGFLAVEVDAPGFSGVVVNLHLYAHRQAAEVPITRRQLAEVVAFARAQEATGRGVLLGGDFNLDRADLEAGLPDGWTASLHGATYDAGANPFASAGWNRGAASSRVRTIDFLVNSSPAATTVRSAVLDRVPLSDHWFLEHEVVAAGG